jgi:predicted acetyltransferase
MEEFFIIAKFQGLHIARNVACAIWKLNPGQWEIAVIPQNKRALMFWEKSITLFTKGVFKKSTQNITYDMDQPKRIVFNFEMT